MRAPIWAVGLLALIIPRAGRGAGIVGVMGAGPPFCLAAKSNLFVQAGVFPPHRGFDVWLGRTGDFPEARCVAGGVFTLTQTHSGGNGQLHLSGLSAAYRTHHSHPSGSGYRDGYVMGQIFVIKGDVARSNAVYNLFGVLPVMETGRVWGWCRDRVCAELLVRLGIGLSYFYAGGGAAGWVHWGRWSLGLQAVVSGASFQIWSPAGDLPDLLLTPWMLLAFLRRESPLLQTGRRGP